ncbi:hypothetical protein SDJN02_10802, partial [Cucurbita argyrosperma subsp. argyrosperma]
FSQDFPGLLQLNCRSKWIINTRTIGKVPYCSRGGETTPIQQFLGLLQPPQYPYTFRLTVSDQSLSSDLCHGSNGETHGELILDRAKRLNADMIFAMLSLSDLVVMLMPEMPKWNSLDCPVRAPFLQYPSTLLLQLSLRDSLGETCSSKVVERSRPIRLVFGRLVVRIHPDLND